jgi:hypothetical protein
MVRNTRFLVAVCLTAAMFAGASCATASGSTPVTAAPVAAAPALASHTYDVRDLVIPMRPTGKALITLDPLAQNLMQATDCAYWERPNWTVQTADAGYLVVSASPAMHERVLQYLNDMRRLATKQ